MTKSMAFAYILLLLVPSERQAQACVPRAQVSTSQAKDRLTEGLQQVIAGRASLEDAARIVFEAGDSGDREFITLLKRIVDAAPKDPPETNRYHDVSFHALLGLWKLGEPKRYFLDNVITHQRDKMVVYWSAFILARDPDDTTLSVLKKARDDSRETSIDTAYRYAFFVRNHVDELAKIKMVPQKTVYLLKVVGAGCFVHTSDVKSPSSYWNYPAYGQQPLSAWAREQVLQLSRKSPRLVAETVFRIDFRRDLGIASTAPDPMCGPLTKPLYRKFVANFISNEARAALLELGKQAVKRK